MVKFWYIYIIELYVGVKINEIICVWVGIV